MCRIFEISKEAMCSSQINGAIIVSLGEYDAVIVPDGATHLLSNINPRDINMTYQVDGKATDIALKLNREKEEL